MSGLNFELAPSAAAALRAKAISHHFCEALAARAACSGEAVDQQFSACNGPLTATQFSACNGPLTATQFSACNGPLTATQFSACNGPLV